MSQTNLTTKQVHAAPVGKRMLWGALIALVLISLFISGAETDPSWSPYWRIRPLIVVPFAGAMGGVFYYFMDHLRYQGGWKMIAANVISLLVYIVALWMGTVLGLVGTLWN
jgi:hypothetical protein